MPTPFLTYREDPSSSNLGWSLPSTTSIGPDWLAYRIDGSGARDGVYVQPVNGGTPTLVTHTGTPAFFWSPTGSALLLLTVTGRGSSRVARWGVWSGDHVVTSDPYQPSQTFGEQYLPFFDQYAQAFTPWAPDGSAFAFAGVIDGTAGVYVQPVDGGAPTRVSDGGLVLWSPPERPTSPNQTGDRRREPGELLDVERCEVGEHARAASGQRHTDQPVVARVGSRVDQPRLLGTVDELARAVVPQQQLFGDLPDRRRAVVAEPLHHDEELVLGGRDPLRLGGVVAPPEEPPEGRPERQELRIVHIHGAGVHVNISYHDIS